MAGFDKVDPANPCMICSCPRSCVGRPAHDGRVVSNFIEKCQRRSWTREFQWSKNTPCTGEPESQARCAC
jgi:hypothetical protein